jgi:UDP-sugar transporter A1/2/3
MQKETSEARFARILSWTSLSLLVFQNCSAVLLMRWTQTRPGAIPFSKSAAVVAAEVVKLLVCLIAMAVTRVPFGDVLRGEPLKLIIPAGLYALQNNLLYVALANLEATLFQVTYQTKLLMTALLMIIMLNKRLTWVKWIALFILFLGIVLTQLDAKKASRADADSQNLVTGVFAVLMSALSSGFAGVYFEKIVKNASSSLLVRNVQLAFFSVIILSPAYSFLEDRQLVNLLDGFDAGVWLLVMVQAAGGLLVAAVIKYADNILKGFATAIAIVVSGLVSYFFLDFVPTTLFLFGVLLVMVSTAMYSMPDQPEVSPKSP